MRTCGISPKVPAQAIVTVLAFIVAHFGIELDDDVSAALAVILGAAAGYQAPPGDVVQPKVGEASDDVLLADRATRQRIAGQSLVELVIVLFVLVLIAILVLKYL